MKKAILSLALLGILSTSAIAEECSTVAENCTIDQPGEIVLPYFNTRSNWHTRFRNY
jgi:hypothetical protein